MRLLAGDDDAPAGWRYTLIDEDNAAVTIYVDPTRFIRKYGIEDGEKRARAYLIELAETVNRAVCPSP